MNIIAVYESGTLSRFSLLLMTDSPIPPTRYELGYCARPWGRGYVWGIGTGPRQRHRDSAVCSSRKRQFGRFDFPLVASPTLRDNTREENSPNRAWQRRIQRSGASTLAGPATLIICFSRRVSSHSAGVDVGDLSRLPLSEKHSKPASGNATRTVRKATSG